ncbi:dihydromonapterin reductase [Nitrincola tibetensis]|uniref:Dihydromonapterin reductase n=1 Tax=Nitrincola tibetensis TaxID=2219697 RepID=A0A364NQF5_9GAMM|nr:dihydromonapterin reductase [Nitrincola tibetensis]RAU19284.1 dihydromonapterin reductase [Nitrincola tibetensis]
MSKVVLITGVGRRLGLVLSTRLLEQGWQVIGTYRTETPVIETLRNLGMEAYKVDFKIQQEVNDFIGKIKDRHARLDALIHNASDWLPESDTGRHFETIEYMMQVHVNAPYVMNLELSALLQASDGMADIIHVTDYVAEKGSQKHIAYAASKAALANMTLSFAQLLAPKVKVNAIAPALMLFNETDDNQYKVKARAKSILQREGGADEFIRAVEYLLASTYVTGRTLPLDGGRHIK